jgi:molybdenum cofactor cytidylyltransferase
MELIRAVRLGESPRIALVGAGGKTTALFRIASEYSRPVILAASTHLAVSQTARADTHHEINTRADFSLLKDQPLQGINLFTGPVEGERTRGLPEEALVWLDRYCSDHSLPLIIEADGSRERPIKAPADYEPPIPPFVNKVVVLAGLSAIGKRISSEWVHRPEIFAALSGFSLGEAIIPEAIARVLTHPNGGLKNISPTTTRIAILNQADSPELREMADQMAQSLLPMFHSVITASLNFDQGLQNEGNSNYKALGDKGIYAVHEQIAGVVLAGGEALRFGAPKQLLPWYGRPLVWHAASKAIEAGLRPVTVVTGAYPEQIQAALSDLPVSIIHNPNWNVGQGTSVRAGVKALPKNCGGTVFLLADQPQIPISLLQSLVKVHARRLSAIIAPWTAGRIANPVLFDRDLFPELISLSGEVGGRSLFSKHEVVKVPWEDSTILFDVDTPEDYERLLGLDG